jgi:hypothetical protein
MAAGAALAAAAVVSGVSRVDLVRFVDDRTAFAAAAAACALAGPALAAVVAALLQRASGPRPRAGR